MSHEDEETREIAGRTYRSFSVTSPEARALGDLQSILNDLDRVVSRCDILLSQNLSDEIREAVWESVVITYYRSFTRGMSGSNPRRQLDVDLIPLGDELRKTHELIKRERNKHVGHRHDEIGEFHVVTRIEDVDPNGVDALGVVVTRRGSPYVEPQAAKDLANALISVYDRVYEDEHFQLADKMRSEKFRQI